MKVLVAYQSRYGSTKQYAEWIQERFQAAIIDLNQNIPNYSDYDIIVLGSYLHAGSIQIAKHLVQNWELIKEKEVILFTCSAMPTDNSRIKKIYEKDLPQEIREKTKCFPLCGKIIHEYLNLMDKILMFVGTAIEKDSEMKKGMKTDYDGLKQENLIPLYGYISELIDTNKNR